MKTPRQTANVQEIVDFYLHSSAFLRLSGSSQQDYEAQLKAVCATEVQGKPLGAYRCKTLKVAILMDAYDQWVETGVRTANYRKSVLSAAWKHAMRHDVLINNPVALVQTVSSQPRRVKWEREHVMRFLDTAYSDFRWRSMGLLIQMSYEWGQRVGDMRVLKWDRLDLQGCRLDLTQSKRGAEVHLPISMSLCEMLRRQREDFQELSEYVAPRTRAKAGRYSPYTKEEISPLVNDILEAAGLPKELTAMDLRRTAVTEMMEGGVDLAGIMQVTGHKNVASVKPYMVNTYSGATKALAARGNEDD